MTVYVDTLLQTTPTRRWPYHDCCHLSADSHDELMAFAKRLKLKPEWIQAEGKWHEHFDLNAMTRQRAVTLGAVEESLRASVLRMRSGAMRGHSV